MEEYGRGGYRLYLCLVIPANKFNYEAQTNNWYIEYNLDGKFIILLHKNYFDSEEEI